MPTMHTIEEHEAQQVKPYIDAKIGAVGNVSGDPKTVSYADIVSIKDGAGVLAKDVSIKIEPVQAGSGTPSPSNVRAISGRTEVTVTRAGKNLIPNGRDSANGYYVNKYLNSDGTYGDSNNFYISEYFRVKEGAEYTFWDKNNSENAASICFYDANKIFISGVALQQTVKHITVPAKAVYARSTQWNSGSIIQFEAGNTATECVPFVASDDYTIDLGGTIYGGTLDVTSGKLTVDRIFKEYDGTETWTASESYSNTYYTAYPSGINTTSTANVPYGMCNAYVYASGSLGSQDNAYLLGYNLNIRDTVHGTSLADWTAYVTANHLQFVFPLTTPQVIQLTPTQIRMLAGVNTVYANTGDTQVEYFNASVGNLGEVIGDVQEEVQDKIDLASLQTVVAASSDFADFQTRIANL